MPPFNWINAIRRLTGHRGRQRDGIAPPLLSPLPADRPPRAASRGGPLDMLVACERIVLSGGLLRFDRVSEALEDEGHRIVFCPRLPGCADDITLHAGVMDLETAARRPWHAVMVPGAGFAPDTRTWLSVFRDARFGVRIQHVLNDRNRRAAFLDVNRSFAPDMVVFNNLAWQPEHFADFGGDQFHVLPGAVDTEFFVPSAKPPDGVFTIVGQTRKGPAPLVKALRRMDGSVRLVLFGPVKESFARQNADLIARGALELPGVLDKAGLRSLYARADACVHVETFAGWANMAAEALATGTPLLCTRAGTETFARDGETALVMDAPGTKDILAGLEKIRGAPDAAAQRAIRGRAAIEEFGWQTYSSRLVDLVTDFPEDPDPEAFANTAAAG